MHKDRNRRPNNSMEKILRFLCCPAGLCQSIYDCIQGLITDTKDRDVHREQRSSSIRTSSTKIRKEDIEYLIDRQPVTRFDSVVSHASVSSSSCSAGGGRGGGQEDSPRSNNSFLERVDSDKSQESCGRASSSSSTGSEYRRCLVSSNPKPIIDMRPIEFWTANKQQVQPRSTHQRRRLPSESEISLDDLRPDLYAAETVQKEDGDDNSCLTDEEKLSRFQLGQIHFNLQYELSTKRLIVRMIEARDLALPYSHDSNRQDMAHSNPYARVCLLPDPKNSQQTSVRRKTQDPTWEETFLFDMSLKDVHRRTLEITVKDFDKFSRHCIIGQVHLDLGDVNLIKGGHMWKPLLPCARKNPDLGEILLSLNYLPTAGRLNIDIIKAHQILQTDFICGTDPFVKVALVIDRKVIKTKKTSTQRNTIDPVYNESLSFNVTHDQLGSCSLVVSVWDHNSKVKDEFIGRIVMGKQSTSHFEAAHWNKMIHCQRSPIAQWHTILSREECDRKCDVSVVVS